MKRELRITPNIKITTVIIGRERCYTKVREGREEIITIG